MNDKGINLKGGESLGLLNEEFRMDQISVTRDSRVKGCQLHRANLTFDGGLMDMTVLVGTYKMLVYSKHVDKSNRSWKQQGN